MKKKNRILLITLVVISALLLYDNLSPFSYGELTTTDWGTNTDITDGRLSGSESYSCVFILNGNDTIRNGQGKHRIIVKETEMSFGIMSYIPFYKKIRPAIKFDCYLENPWRYIGKIEIKKDGVAIGISRKHLKTMIVKQYTDECIAMLNEKSIPYDVIHDIYNEHPNFANASSGKGSPKLRALLREAYTNFTREIPIRAKEDIYTDTILLTPTNVEKHAKYEVFTVDKTKKEIRFKSIGNNGDVLFTDIFNLKKWREDNGSYQSFIAYPKR